MGHNSIKVCGKDFTINGQVYTYPTHVLWDTAKGLGQGGKFWKACQRTDVKSKGKIAK